MIISKKKNNVNDKLRYEPIRICILTEYKNVVDKFVTVILL